MIMAKMASTFKIGYNDRLPEIAKFPDLATLGRHNYETITNAENSRPNGSLTGCLVSIFTVTIASKPFSWMTNHPLKGMVTFAV